MWLLDAAKAGRPKRLKGHAGAVRKLLFHPLDPHLLTSSSDDRSLRTWNTDNGQCLQVLGTDATRLLDFGFVPDTGHLVLATVCRVRKSETERSQLSKLARSTFGFLAKSAGGDKVADRLRAEDASSLLNLVLVSYDAETGSFVETVDIQGEPCDKQSTAHVGMLTPACDALCCSSHKRTSLWGIQFHDMKQARGAAGLDEVAITILPGGETERALTSEDASVEDTKRASSDISEVP
jgi:WD40 repeat protein